MQMTWHRCCRCGDVLQQAVHACRRACLGAWVCFAGAVRLQLAPRQGQAALCMQHTRCASVARIAGNGREGCLILLMLLVGRLSASLLGGCAASAALDSLWLRLAGTLYGMT